MLGEDMLRGEGHSTLTGSNLKVPSSRSTEERFENRNKLAKWLNSLNHDDLLQGCPVYEKRVLRIYPTHLEIPQPPLTIPSVSKTHALSNESKRKSMDLVRQTVPT